MLTATVTDSGRTTLAPYEGERRVSVQACAERLRIAALGGRSVGNETSKPRRSLLDNRDLANLAREEGGKGVGPQVTVDPTVIPGLLLLAAELLALAAVGYVVARVALRQTNDLLALAQGLVIGLALWGLIVNFLLHLFLACRGTGGLDCCVGPWRRPGLAQPPRPTDTATRPRRLRPRQRRNLLDRPRQPPAADHPRRTSPCHPLVNDSSRRLATHPFVESGSRPFLITTASTF